MLPPIVLIQRKKVVQITWNMKLIIDDFYIQLNTKVKLIYLLILFSDVKYYKSNILKKYMVSSILVKEKRFFVVHFISNKSTV